MLRDSDMRSSYKSLSGRRRAWPNRRLLWLEELLQTACFGAYADAPFAGISNGLAFCAGSGRISTLVR